MFYFIKTPGWLQLLCGACTWSIATKEKIIYLTFDDGPHPLVTPFVLDELKKINAKATFFCIGKNVVANPSVYERILLEGHAVGNHTHNHLNGWKTNDTIYLNDIAEASDHIKSTLFRPPYGRFTRFQIQQLSLPRFKLKPIMWSVLSGDFDIKLTPLQCVENILLNCFPGAIVVFHDSEKAFERLKFSLPEILRCLSDKGYRFDKIEG